MSNARFSAPGIPALAVALSVGAVHAQPQGMVAGVGAYIVKTDLTGVPNAGSTRDLRPGVNGGAGLVVRLGSLVSAYAEGRVDNAFTERGVIDTEQIQVAPVTFGIVF